MMRNVFSILLLVALSLQLSFSIPSASSIEVYSSEEVEDAKCPQNYYFSETRNRCMICTECGTNLYEKEECQPDRDTVCDWCLTKNPTMNEEYFRQCDDYKKLYDKLREELKADISEGHHRTTQMSSKRFDWLLWLVFVFAAACFVIVIFTVGCLSCMRRRYTRVINVSPPELSEIDQHNIIYAAKQIREKFDKRGEVNYEYL
ncbi:hypothetical protein M3Y98_00291200 [Aphelenchoides besseyi]|nr:hypothetical protein M3Y98_00291200 [Aphelenchoides besseyi]